MATGIRWLLSTLALGAACMSTAGARAQEFAPRVQGLGWDAQLAGGVGAAFDGGMDNPFLARARLGILYAFEPWMLNLGPTFEVGALAELGFGGELEVNHFEGLFVDLGVATAHGETVLTHVTAGYTIFGIEWQHHYAAQDNDALLLHVRLPFGMWWLFEQKEEEKAEQRRAQGSPPAGVWRKPPDAVNPPPDPAANGGVPASPPLDMTPPQLPLLRLEPRGDIVGMQVELDGKLEPTAALGYDLHVEPGEHRLVVRSESGVLLRQAFTVREGELVRIPVPSEPASEPAPAP